MVEKVVESVITIIRRIATKLARGGLGRLGNQGFIATEICSGCGSNVAREVNSLDDLRAAVFNPSWKSK